MADADIAIPAWWKKEAVNPTEGRLGPKFADAGAASRWRFSYWLGNPG
jgi:hypothetical protein